MIYPKFDFGDQADQSETVETERLSATGIIDTYFNPPEQQRRRALPFLMVDVLVTLLVASSSRREDPRERMADLKAFIETELQSAL
jgi:hypothetical protein